MDEPLAAQGIRFREFRWADIPALVEIRTRTSPENPGSQERMEYFEKTYPADNPRLRYIVENAAGKCIGQGSCERSTFISVPGMYFMWIIVDPDYRRRGIAQALLPRFEAYARAQGMDKLSASCHEDQDYSIRFLEKAGFYLLGQRFESMLDLTTFDEDRFAGTLERLQAAGFEFTNLVDERASIRRPIGCCTKSTPRRAGKCPGPAARAWKSPTNSSGSDPWNRRLPIRRRFSSPNIRTVTPASQWWSSVRGDPRTRP